MYLRRLILENIKGFEKLDFTFDRGQGASLSGWTVITGDNGAGKTALLKAIALALVGPGRARALQPDLRGWIREGEPRGRIHLELECHLDDAFRKGAYVHTKNGEALAVDLVLDRNGGDEVSLLVEGVAGDGGWSAVHGPWAEETRGWFLVGYGPFRRLYGTSPEAQRLISSGGRLSRFATLFREDATLSEGELWLKELDYRRLEGRKRESRWLEQVKALLNRDFLTHGVRIERVDSEGLWLRDAAGTVLPVSELSDGYRAALAMLVDLLRHFALALPEGEELVEEKEGEIRVPHGGVVLIDEIDAHLHPAWQRRIGDWLTARFPSVQFLVTTHSPLVCSAADARGIFHLPAPGQGEAPFRLSEDDYWRVKRSRADQILLTPAFGLSHTRTPETVEARYQHARLMAKSRAVKLGAEESNRLQQLELFLDEPEV